MRSDIEKLWGERKVHGLELIADTVLLGLRWLSVSYGLRSSLLPKASEPERIKRDNAVDVYCIVQLAVLVVLLTANPFGWFLNTLIAGYILFEIVLVLLNIIFIGKFSDINAPPASVERSILLLGLNVLQVVTAFAVLYRDWLGLSGVDAFFKAALVLGTVGYPEAPGNLGLLVALQVFIDLILLVLLISSFVGNIALFRSKRGS